MSIPRRAVAFIFLLCTCQNHISGFHNARITTAATRSSILSGKKTRVTTVTCDNRCSSVLFCKVNISEDAPRDIQSLEQRAYKCGVERSGGLEFTAENTLGTYDGSRLDISFMTTEDIPAGSPILYVPNVVILSSYSAITEFGRLEDAENRLRSLNAESQIRHYYLMLKILAEWELGTQSEWYTWLNSLPRYYSNAVSMTPFCCKCLPNLMADLARKERASMNNLMIKQVPFLSIETRCNADLWVWAYQVVYTRSFEANDGSGDLCIVPMGDYFNHGAEANIAMKYDDSGNFRVGTTRDVPAGSPLHMSYGDPTNPSFLFARYGFLDRSSPATFCKIMLPYVSDELLGLGYTHERMLFYKDTGEVSREVWDVLLYQVLSAPNIALGKNLYKAHMDGDEQTKQLLHEQYYSETSRKLLIHIDSFIQQLEELSAKTIGMDINQHPRLPIILNHNEFVRDTFLAVRARYFE